MHSCQLVFVYMKEAGREFYLERELGRGARGDWAERAPEVNGGGKRTGSEQHRSLRTERQGVRDTHTHMVQKVS